MSTMAMPIAPERGCGMRKAGGIYAEVPLSPFGVPLSHFLFEPPQEFDVETLGVTPVGVTLIEMEGVTHIVDWVGESFYPNVADMIDEIRSMGLSRRLPSNLDFERLTPGSKIILLHRKALVANHKEVGMTYEDVGSKCPKDLDYPDQHPPGMCIGGWYHDLTGTLPAVDGDDGAVVRRMPNGSSYRGIAPNEKKRKYRVAAFAAFHVSQITVVNDPDGGKHHGAMDVARKSSLPVALEAV